MTNADLMLKAKFKYHQVKGWFVHNPEAKHSAELSYWKHQAAREGALANGHYHYFYTEFFSLPDAFYAGKRVLDVGCGPRGSLEWADMAAERVGVDPLAEEYLFLGADRHKMSYVKAGAEQIPFENGRFDVICSFNSLDHVDDLDRCIGEIVRLLAPGGTFLLIVESHREPTAFEPVTLGMEIVDRFSTQLEAKDVRRLAMSEPGIYESAKRAVPYDTTSPERDSLICGRFQKPRAAVP